MAATKFGAHLRALRIHLCPKSDESKGLREFIKKHYVPLKSQNPRFPILIRECSGIQPVLYARYAQGKESSASLSGLSSDQVLQKINEFSLSPSK